MPRTGCTKGHVSCYVCSMNSLDHCCCYKPTAHQSKSLDPEVILGKLCLHHKLCLQYPEK